MLIVLALAYLWLVSIGRWVVKRGDRRLLADGTARNWHFSSDPALADTIVILISAAAIQSQRASSATAFIRKPLGIDAIEGFLQRLPT